MAQNLTASRRGPRAKKFLLDYSLYILFAAVIIVYAASTPLFLSARNIKELLANSSALLVAAVGMTFVLLIGEIDLSIGSVAGVCAAVWVICTNHLGMPLVLATLIGLICGIAIGTMNAFLITKLKISSFLATLGMQIFMRGLVYITVSGQQILIGEQVKRFLGHKPFGISPLVFISIALAAVMTLVYRYTAFGRKAQAVGCNKASAKKVGIHPERVTFRAYMLMGALAALAGMTQSANIGILNPSNIGDGLEFLAITAVVLGGTSLLGGFGTIVPGTLVGVCFLMSIENGLGLLGANPYVYPIIRGIIIYLGMFSDSLKRSIGKN